MVEGMLTGLETILATFPTAAAKHLIRATQGRAVLTLKVQSFVADRTRCEEGALHTAPAVRSQREKNTVTQLPFSYLYSSGELAQGMVTTPH